MQLRHACGLSAQARWHAPPHTEVTEDYPENVISVSAIGSPLSDSNNHKNFVFPPCFLPCPLPAHCNSDSIHKAQSLLLPAENCFLKRNWRCGMTVILASLAMDLWHGLFLPRRMNTSCAVCCALLTFPFTNKDIEKRMWDSGQGQMQISVVCRTVLRDASLTENGSDHQACCTVHFTSVP